MDAVLLSQLRLISKLAKNTAENVFSIFLHKNVVHE